MHASAAVHPHLPLVQVCPVGQSGPHVPPEGQPSGPHCLPPQRGVHPHWFSTPPPPHVSPGVEQEPWLHRPPHPSGAPHVLPTQFGASLHTSGAPVSLASIASTPMSPSSNPG